MLISQIILGHLFSQIIDNKKFKPNTPGLGFAILISAGFFSVAILRNLTGLVLLILFSGGIGLQIKTLYAKEINDEIASHQRATVLSFIGMLRRIVLTAINPIVGFAVDSIGVYNVLFWLGMLSLISVKFLPDKVNETLE